MPALPPPDAAGLLGKLLAAVAAGVLLVLGALFSVVLVALAVVLGAAALGYFWWKTRALRNVLREQAAQQAAQHAHADRQRAPAKGRVFDGEAVVVDAAPSHRPVIKTPHDLA